MSRRATRRTRPERHRVLVGPTVRAGARIVSALRAFVFSPASALVAVGLLMGCGEGGRDPGSEIDDLDPVMLPASLPAEIGEIFPPTGDRGRVLNNCSTCHSVVCAAIGQRTPEEWTAIERSHAGYIPGLSLEDFGKIFIYLRRNFNDTLPEPRVSPELLADGCPRLEPVTADSAAP